MSHVGPVFGVDNSCSKNDKKGLGVWEATGILVVHIETLVARSGFYPVLHSPF
jgi:hypothetical protein